VARIGYDALPVGLRGSPGAMGRFRVARMIDPIADPAAIFSFMAAAVAVLLAIGWLRRLVADMGPD